MVLKSAGEKKKELILNTCKKLFYEKGYNNTTFEDIGKEADIYSGSITYHFENKIKIAGIIRVEYEQKELFLFSSFQEKITDLKLLSAIQIINFWELLHRDFNIRRFFYEIYQEAIISAYLFETMRYNFHSHVEKYNLDICEKELDLMTGASIGMEREFLNMFFNNPERFSKEELSSYTISNSYRFLGYDYSEINEIIVASKEVFQTLKINYDYYRYFKYETTP